MRSDAFLAEGRPLDASLHSRSTAASYRGLLTDLTKMGLAPCMMRDAAAQGGFAGMAALRHDVDYHLGRALMMGSIEQDMGVRATYYLLHPGHDAHLETYYGRLVEGRVEHRADLFEAARALVEMGHEVGLHNDFLYLSMLTGRPVAELIAEEVRAFANEGVPVTGSASHGSRFSRRSNFVNYEVFAQCPRPDATVYVDRADPVEPGRVIVDGAFEARLNAVDMTGVGLTYEAYFVGPCLYVMDAGGEITVRWFHDGAPVVESLPALTREALDDALIRSGAAGIQLLTHADHWVFSDTETEGRALRARMSASGGVAYREPAGHILPTGAPMATVAAMVADPGLTLRTVSDVEAAPDRCAVTVQLIAGVDPEAVDRMTRACRDAGVTYTLFAPVRWHDHPWGDVAAYPLEWDALAADVAAGRAEVGYLYNALHLADADPVRAHSDMDADVAWMRSCGLGCTVMTPFMGVRSPVMPTLAEEDLSGDNRPRLVALGGPPCDASYTDAPLPRAARIKTELDPSRWLKANRAPGRRLAMIFHPHHYGPTLLLADPGTPRWMLNARARYAPTTEI